MHQKNQNKTKQKNLNNSYKKQRRETKSVTGFTRYAQIINSGVNYSYYTDLKKNPILQEGSQQVLCNVVCYARNYTTIRHFLKTLPYRLSRNCTFLTHLPRLWWLLLTSVANPLLWSYSHYAPGTILFPFLSELLTLRTLTRKWIITPYH